MPRFDKVENGCHLYDMIESGNVVLYRDDCIHTCSMVLISYLMGIDTDQDGRPSRPKPCANTSKIVQSYSTVAATRRLTCTSFETAVQARHAPVFIEALGKVARYELPCHALLLVNGMMAVERSRIVGTIPVPTGHSDSFLRHEEKVIFNRGRSICLWYISLFNIAV